MGKGEGKQGGGDECGAGYLPPNHPQAGTMEKTVHGRCQTMQGGGKGKGGSGKGKGGKGKGGFLMEMGENGGGSPKGKFNLMKKRSLQKKWMKKRSLRQK